MGIPFFVNAIGKAVVTLAAVEGRKEMVARPIWELRMRNRGTKANS